MFIECIEFVFFFPVLQPLVKVAFCFPGDGMPMHTFLCAIITCFLPPNITIAHLGLNGSDSPSSDQHSVMGPPSSHLGHVGVSGLHSFIAQSVLTPRRNLFNFFIICLQAQHFSYLGLKAGLFPRGLQCCIISFNISELRNFSCSLSKAERVMPTYFFFKKLAFVYGKARATISQVLDSTSGLGLTPSLSAPHSISRVAWSEALQDQHPPMALVACGSEPQGLQRCSSLYLCPAASLWGCQELLFALKQTFLSLKIGNYGLPIVALQIKNTTQCL